MPDDLSAEQEAEDMTDDQMENLFNEDEENSEDDADTDEGTDDESGEEENDDEETSDDDNDSDDSDEEESDDDEDEESEEDEDDDDHSDESAADRVKRMVADNKKETEESDTESEVTRRMAEREAEIREEVTKELMGAEELTIGDRKINVTELREEYGEELVDFMTALALQAAGTTTTAKGEDYVSRKDFDAMRADLAAEKHNSALQSRHSDLNISAMQADGKHKFWGWLDKQDKDAQALFDGNTIEGQSAVLDMFKEATVKSSNKNRDSDARDKKKKHTDLHGSTARTKKKGKDGGGKSRTKGKGGDGEPPLSESEELALFNEFKVND